ncbi:ABC transporter ATP-binding protein [Leucothrix pacifica]|uniref:ABC transporter n=1 Tax=Leucothrix pacifica TaxID=1247513 RepID=A0A317C408_9GAMM|nr:ATP-binding cassette domain-containing protein [Leucothrix pacifica]PWQ93037.1 ABC transporter [Leucothrix pacifica]
MVDNTINYALETTALGKKIQLKNNQSLSILHDITLQIPQGSSVAITGASGSGKTTLLGLLAGLDTASTGDVKLLGQSMVDLDEDQRAALRLGQVGFVFQSFHLMNNLSALENILLPLELEQSVSDPHKAALEALEQVGLSNRATHLPTQLSGGEQQRVALARAFVNKPKVLFADEPTGNLDQATSTDIEQLLFKLQKDNNSTLVLVTHDDALADQCQIHYRIVDGQLVTEA